MTADEPARMKWWGWGDPEASPELPERAAELLGELGASGRRAHPVALEDVRLGEPLLGERARRELAAVVGERWLRGDHLTRVQHAAGKGYPDLVRMRAGKVETGPDAVVYPESAEQVRAVLELCEHQGVAVVPFGGGTSVVGGVEPVRGAHGSLITLDLGRMTRVTDVDARSLTAALGPGLRGPQVEAELARSGLTLGHFPQSFEYSTVGGWIATRSAGQASTGYGTIEQMVAGLDCQTPAGEVSLGPCPASAAGPDLRELLVGSEGVLGAITQATLRVKPQPAVRRYEGWMFKSFPEGAEALRRLEQAGLSPEIARLSDEHETRLSLALAAGGSARQRAGRLYVRARGFGGGCVTILGFEGDRAGVARRRAQAARIVRSAGGLSLGTAPGRAWQRGRYGGPYLRDVLLDHCVMVETLETAARWSRLMDLYGAVRRALTDALAARGTPPLVMCHVSHLYPDGASLYFTFIAPQQEGAELRQWRAAKSAATDAIVATGGTITHHHAVGRDHAPWLPSEVGDVGVETLEAVKARLDPSGIMNPGKLLPAESAPKAAP